MYPQVMFGIVKKKNYKSQPALLKNYTRRQVKGRSYPGIMKADNKELWGVVYMNI